MDKHVGSVSGQSLREMDEVNDMDGKRLKDLIEKRSTIWTIGFCMTGIIVLGSIASLERAQRSEIQQETEAVPGAQADGDLATEENGLEIKPVSGGAEKGMDEAGADEGKTTGDEAGTVKSDTGAGNKEENAGDASGTAEENNAVSANAEGTAEENNAVSANAEGTAEENNAVSANADSGTADESNAVSANAEGTADENNAVSANADSGTADESNAVSANAKGTADESNAVSANADSGTADEMDSDAVAAASSDIISEQMLMDNGVSYEAQGASLLWPAAGTILIDYSMDGSVYFPTLNQYKYNPALVIGSDTGNQVLASAKGIVESTYTDEETGTTLVLNIGNGYKLTYGGLKELQAGAGDVLESGEVIGYVSEPTKYYSTEGSNVWFEMTKDGEPVDPILYLE